MTMTMTTMIMTMMMMMMMTTTTTTITTTATNARPTLTFVLAVLHQIILVHVVDLRCGYCCHHRTPPNPNFTCKVLPSGQEIGAEGLAALPWVEGLFWKQS